MKPIVLLALLVGLAAGGCGKDKEGDAAGAGSAAPTRRMGLQTADDCDRLGKKTSVDSMAMTPPGTPDDQRARLQAMSDEAGAAIAGLCKSAGWSGEAVACGLAAKDPAKECDGKLTAAQKQKLESTVQAIFQKGAAAMSGSMGGSAAPAASGGAGSAAPAGSGSGSAPATP